MDPDNGQKASSKPKSWDRTEESAAREPPWVASVSRTAGMLARRITSSLDTVASSLVPHRRLRPLSAAELESLLARLGRMVQSSVGAYGTLKDSEEFWALIAQLADARRSLGRRTSSQSEPGGRDRP
jgi:hypothetical protein